MESERKPKDEKVTLGGRPALYMEFEGDDPEHVAMSGECYMTAFRGFAYWFFTWTPNDDNKDISREQLDNLRSTFRVLDGRKGWTEKPPETEKRRARRRNIN